MLAGVFDPWAATTKSQRRATRALDGRPPNMPLQAYGHTPVEPGALGPQPGEPRRRPRAAVGAAVVLRTSAMSHSHVHVRARSGPGEWPPQLRAWASSVKTVHNFAMLGWCKKDRGEGTIIDAAPQAFEI
jgi:hypothetical protein